MSSNFSFLRGNWKVLANLGETAEKNVYQDPHTTILKLRLFAETLAQILLASENMKEVRGTNQVDRINMLKREGLLEPELVDMFHTLRTKGNKAAHNGHYGETDEAITLLQIAYRLAVWFMEVYGDDWSFDAPEFVKPVDEPALDLEQMLKEHNEEVQKLEQQLELARLKAASEANDSKTERKKERRSL